jgi:hypothetical protein
MGEITFGLRLVPVYLTPRTVTELAWQAILPDGSLTIDFGAPQQALDCAAYFSRGREATANAS